MRAVKILAFVVLALLGTFISLFVLEMLVHGYYHWKMDEIRQKEEIHHEHSVSPVQPTK